MSLTIQNRSVASTSSSLPPPAAPTPTASPAAARHNIHFQKDAFVDGNSSRAQQLLGAVEATTFSSRSAGLTVPQVDLDFGNTGPDVHNLQKCLVALGFMGQDQLNSGPGNFGLITQQAVKDFQSRHGIQPANGRFGPTTRATLQQEVARLGQTNPPAGNFNTMVNDLYRQVFKRDADPGGMATWTQKAQQMQSQGASSSQIRSALHNELANSREGQAVAMVEQAFSDFLGRTNPDRSWWHDEAMRRLDSGQSFEAVRDSVRWSIRTSDEFYLKNPQQLVHDIYQGELGRQADGDGMGTHMATFNNMRAQGRSIGEIRDSIINSVRSSSEWQGKGVSAEQFLAIVNVPGRTMSLAEAQALVPHLNAAMREFGITTPQQKAAFIAQCTHETDYFRTFTEYASGHAYEGRTDLGNTQSGDGPRFRGRGAIQLTGRNNYTEASRHFGVDFTREPNNQLVAQPEWAFRTAGWFFSSRGLTEMAKNPANFDNISVRVNGGVNGFQERRDLFARARGVFGF
jgi:putative chitinase